MSQTRVGSFVEACINVAIGYGINFTANMLLFPLFGWHITVGENLVLGLFYTAISVARSYVVRRWFNARIVRLADRVAGEPRPGGWRPPKAPPPPPPRAGDAP